MITRDAVQAAHARLADHVRLTPVLAAEAELLGHRVVLKLECLQHTGAFKARGALNATLAAAERGELPRAGLIAASGGNHGLGVAFAARTAGVPAEIFVPTTAPAVKVAALRAFGASVTQVGSEFAEALAACSVRAAETGALAIHAYDDADVIAGQGTIATQLSAQLDGFDTVLVSVGGGGLSAGLVAGLGGVARVVAVEAEGTPTYARAREAGGPVDVVIDSVAADSLGARRLGTLPWQVLSAADVPSVLVPDEAIRATQHRLWSRARLVVEPGAATAAAALLGGGYKPEPDERVVVVLCGANTDPASVATPA